MPKLFDKDGNEVDAFTADELKAKQEEAVAQYLKDNPDKSTELTEATQKITDLEKQLADGGMSEGQKQRLLKEKEDAEKQRDEATENLSKDIAKLKETVIGTPKKKALEALSKGDKEVRDKLEAKYDSLMKTGDYTEDEEGVLKAMSDAATLVNGTKPAPSFLDGVVGAGVRGESRGNESAPVETENSKAQRKVLGISDQDVEKHAPKPTTT